jgi:hypothetical protein
VKRLNRQLIGWANYFRLGRVSAAYGVVDRHVCHRLRQWLGRKHGVQGTARGRFTYDYLYATLGLVKLPQRLPRFS